MYWTVCCFGTMLCRVAVSHRRQFPGSENVGSAIPEVICRTTRKTLGQPEPESLWRNNTMRRVALVGLFVLVALWSIPTAFAQATVSFAQLNGTILDSGGRAVMGASISLRNLDNNQTYKGATNSSGVYIVPNLTPGAYELTVQNPGFAKYIQTGIVLSVGQTATVDVSLKVASTTEVVNVTTEAPPVEPTRTEISQVIDTTQLQQLPTNGRRFVDFALLTPGVATGRTSLQSTFTEPDTTRISFGGMRDLSNAVTVDGADYINEGT